MKTTNKKGTNSCKLSKLEPQIAEEDIHVYKIFVIEKSYLSNSMVLIPEKYKGPYTNYIYPEIKGDYKVTNPKIISGTVLYPVDCTKDFTESKISKYFPGLYKMLYTKNKDNDSLNLNNSIVYNTECNYYEITKGFLHSLPAPMCSGERGFDSIFWHQPSNERYEEWECIIPKGTLYFQGDRRGSHFEYPNTYASKKLILYRLINKS